MLDESTQSKEAQQEQDQPAEEKVSCFVCKREVERDQARKSGRSGRPAKVFIILIQQSITQRM
jgi:hypothetical protein